MTKGSRSLQKDKIFTILRTLVCFVLLKVCSTTTTANYFNFALSTTTLDPTTQGFTIKGNTPSDLFGRSVRTAGDINNDGYDDIIIGASGYSSNKGRVYVIYGGETADFVNLDLTTALDPHTTGFTITGGTYYYLGASVSTAGDIDDDGYDDIIVGAFAWSSSTGAAFVIYGGPKLSMQNIDFSSGTTLNPSTTGFAIKGSAGGDCLGWSVSTAGDINKDGHADIIIGAYGYGGQIGRAYVIYGGEKSSMQNWDFSTSATLSPLTTGFIITGTAGDQLGWSVSTAGDTNKDEYDDIIIGANGKRSSSGAAYVIYGGERSSMSNIPLTSTTITPLVNGFMIIGPTGNNQLGISVNTAGDIDNDGYADIIIGAKMATQGETGAAYVLYGRERSSMLNYDLSGATLAPTSTGFWVKGRLASDLLGWSVSAAGDMNKDGYNDILIGTYVPTGSQGAAYVIYGGARSSMQNYDLSSFTLNPASSGFRISGKTNGDQFGFSASIAGDINKDGFKDIIIGASDTNSKTGAVYVIHTACAPCWDCKTNCDECDGGRTSCTACSNSYNLYQSTCLSTCPETTFASSSVCQACPTNCKYCGSSSLCTECVSPSLLYQSQCIATCPDTTFESSGECKACPTGCKHCSSSSVCTECSSSYRLYQTQCYSPCPDTTFAASTTTCQDCPTNCNHCSSSSVCTECISPYLLYKSECISTCPLSTVTSPGKCKDCPSNCFYCTSQGSCEVCSPGYALANSLCVYSSYQQAQEKASQAISSATQVLGGVVCVGSVTFPVTALVSTIVQNTRYLNLSVTTDLSEIYKTWSTDLISWDVPNVISDFDHFKTSPPLFSQYGLGSSFLNNFWPTLVNIGIGLATFITCFVLKKFFEQSKYEGWAYSLVQRLIMGSFNFTLIQAYACLDNILFYLVIDVKTNPFNSFFSWASLISASIFLAIGCLLVFFNFWTVKKYQGIKNKNVKGLEDFNERNKYWELFYSDFNDEDLLSQSFFAFLIMRSTLSSFIVTVLYDYPLMQTSFLMTLDGAIILFLFFKNPFQTFRGTLCQYYFEIITLLVHICTFILSFQDSLKTSSDTLRTVLSTGIIYLNTALISGSIGFMFIEIYKTMSEKRRARKLKLNEKHYENIAIQTFNEDNLDTQNFAPTMSPGQRFETDSQRKQETWVNHNEQMTSFENFHLLSGFGNNSNMVMNDFHLEPSQARDFNPLTDDSFGSNVNPNNQIYHSRELSTNTVFIRPAPRSLRQSSQKRRRVRPDNKIHPAHFVNN